MSLGASHPARRSNAPAIRLTVRLLEARTGTATTEPAQRACMQVESMSDSLAGKQAVHAHVAPNTSSTRQQTRMSRSAPCICPAPAPQQANTHFLGSQRLGSATSRVLSYCSRASLICCLLCSSTSVVVMAKEGETPGQLGAKLLLHVVAVALAALQSFCGLLMAIHSDSVWHAGCIHPCIHAWPRPTFLEEGNNGLGQGLTDGCKQQTGNKQKTISWAYIPACRHPQPMVPMMMCAWPHALPFPCMGVCTHRRSERPGHHP